VNGGRTGGQGSAGWEKANGTPMEPRSNCPTVRQSTRHGGAGNRTLVRVSFQNCVYVCRLDFMPSLQSGIEPTSPKPIS
jgi:hypothetical protein